MIEIQALLSMMQVAKSRFAQAHTRDETGVSELLVMVLAAVAIGLLALAVFAIIKSKVTSTANNIPTQ